MADDLMLEPLAGHGLATVMVRKGVDADALGTMPGASPPVAPGWTMADGMRWIGTGPGSWLVQQPDADADWAARLKSRLAGLASVSDQSGGYALYGLAGPRARTVLQRGAFIDLHPAAFHAGSAATTMIAHIGIILWQVDDLPGYQLALFRSFASSFEHWFNGASRAR